MWNNTSRYLLQPHTSTMHIWYSYEGRSESKERFAIQRYLLIIREKQNMQVLSHTFTYFSTYSPWTLRPSKTESRLAPHSRRDLISARSLSQPVTLTTWKSSQHQLHQVTIYTLLNTPHDWSGTMKQLRGLYAQSFFTFRTSLLYTSQF